MPIIGKMELNMIDKCKNCGEPLRKVGLCSDDPDDLCWDCRMDYVREVKAIRNLSGIIKGTESFGNEE